MRYAIEVVTLGNYADPRLVIQLAQAAEAAGWEGLFVWDHLGFAWGVPSGDPWVILAAAAQATTQLKLGTAVTPLPRHRPHVLANILATLDLLSEGRLILGVGLGGVPQEFAAFGEPEGAKQRAELLDEGLAVLGGLLSGETVTHQGPNFVVKEVTLSPRPLQRPRIPIWVGGDSRPALRRAARWDGWITGGGDQNGQMIKTPQEMAEKIAYIQQHRSTSTPFEVAMDGYSTPADRSLVADFAAAGVTWWLESLHGFRGSFEELLIRVKAGPPA